MPESASFPSRRRFLAHAAAGASSFMTAGAFAEQLARTPRQTEGPFYPDKLPLDTDNDLLIINDSITGAIGQITHLTGRVLSPSGEPLRNAVVEIWQADKNGVYLHTRGGDRGRMDANFQGFGRFLTNSKGEYYFRTIKPVPYGPRTPHIHFAVNQGGRRILTTQCYVNGHPLNDVDGVLRRTPPAERKLLMVDWKRLPEASLDEYAANFDLIIGNTPADADEASAARASAADGAR